MPVYCLCYQHFNSSDKEGPNGLLSSIINFCIGQDKRSIKKIFSSKSTPHLESQLMEKYDRVISESHVVRLLVTTADSKYNA